VAADAAAKAHFEAGRVDVADRDRLSRIDRRSHVASRLTALDLQLTRIKQAT
jgi:hypothetical protein